MTVLSSELELTINFKNAFLILGLYITAKAAWQGSQMKVFWNEYQSIPFALTNSKPHLRASKWQPTSDILSSMQCDPGDLTQK